MEKVHEDPEPNSAAISEVIGEPAIVINGIPPVPLVATTSIHLDTTNDAGSNDDPYFGEWLEGRKVLKLFGDRYYSGEVEKYDSEANWYRVTYEDGDFEDLEWHELEDVLVPLDISIPLKALALRRCKCDKSICKSSVSMAKTRKGRPKNIGSVNKTLELPDASQTSEVKGENQVEVDFGRKKRQSIIQIESTKTSLQVCYSDKSVSEAGKDIAISEKIQNAESMVNLSELSQKPTASEGERQLVQATPNKEVTTQEASKTQRKFQKQSGTTSRAEKQKRRNSLVQGTALE
ncbi:putative dirigent protein 17-like [Cocos nucifera]|uniref:Putative dirigent protein 17-like n=1 Tax=Cocos nucifera TaxID=13894 RepID=A0A8K0MZU6_COCNU|nr:putative dirigent protein 17-like [Cocos nucifera]